MSGRNLHRKKRGGPSVVPGRTGAAWRECRRIVIARAGHRCQVCGGALVASTPPGTPDAIEIDHYLTPLHVLRQRLDAGQITENEYARLANSPDGCRALHRRCHPGSGKPHQGNAAVASGYTAPTTPLRDGHLPPDVAERVRQTLSDPNRPVQVHGVFALEVVEGYPAHRLNSGDTRPLPPDMYLVDAADLESACLSSWAVEMNGGHTADGRPVITAAQWATKYGRAA